MIFHFVKSEAQIQFTDDFESYGVGDYLVQNSQAWKTPQNTIDQDVYINADFAHSGTRSVKFDGEPTVGGLVKNIYLPFDKSPLNIGELEFEAYFYVPTGHGAVLTFQSTDPLETEPYYNVEIDKSGSVSFFRNLDGGIISTWPTNFVFNRWTKLNLKVDLNNNRWEVFLDDKLMNSFRAEENTIYAFNLPSFTSTQATNYVYIDDVSFSYKPTLLDRDVNLVRVYPEKPHAIIGSTLALKATVKNSGKTPVTSFKIKTELDGKVHINQVDHINVNSQETLDLFLPDSVAFKYPVNDMKSTVYDVNGITSDDDSTNNESSYRFYGIVPDKNKGVLYEGLSGTWCQACPEEAVVFDRMSKLYPKTFIPVSVHAYDPMAISAYHSELENRFTTIFPTAIVDRLTLMPPGALEEVGFLQNLTKTTKAKIVNGASFDKTTRELKFTVNLEATDKITEDYKVLAIITQDSVRKDENGYEQENLFSGGSTPMGGFENLPNPVPASMMRYDHVARYLLGGFDGTRIGGELDAGDKYQAGYSVVLPADYLEHKLNIIGVLIRPDGTTDNASIYTFDEAIANGLVATEDFTPAASDVRIIPNPVSSSAHVMLNMLYISDIDVTLFNTLGMPVLHKKYKGMTGLNDLPLNTEGLSNGIYNISIKTGHESITRKIVIAH